MLFITVRPGTMDEAAKLTLGPCQTFLIAFSRDSAALFHRPFSRWSGADWGFLFDHSYFPVVSFVSVMFLVLQCENARYADQSTCVPVGQRCIRSRLRQKPWTQRTREKRGFRRVLMQHFSLLQACSNGTLQPLVPRSRTPPRLSWIDVSDSDPHIVLYRSPRYYNAI